MLTRNLIQKEAQRSKEQLQRIDDAVKRRDESPAACQVWKDACRDWHQTETKCFYLWPIEARKRMHAGEREVIEDALLFLEVDPWFFRSGYLKARVLSHLKGAPLSETDTARLRIVIYTVTRGRNRREFTDYCRMALRVWTPAWEEQLRTELAERKWGTDLAHDGSKLTYLLAFLDAHRDKLRASGKP